MPTDAGTPRRPRGGVPAFEGRATSAHRPRRGAMLPTRLLWRGHLQRPICRPRKAVLNRCDAAAAGLAARHDGFGMASLFAIKASGDHTSAILDPAPHL